MNYKNTVSFADIETTPFSETFDKEGFEQLDFLLGCVITYNVDEIEVKRKSFTNLDEFCIYLNKLNRVYFHNLGFDFKFIQERLLTQNTRFKLIQTPSSTLNVKFQKYYGGRYRKTVELRDSVAVLLSSIEKLGKAINLPKLEVKDNNFANIEYCFRDCEIIAKSFFSMIEFINKKFKDYEYELDLLNIPLTIATLSKKIFQKIYPNAFYTHHVKIYDKLRKFYYGGRTEVFNLNPLNDGIYADVVSLYPSIANKYKLPNGKCYYYEIINQDLDFHFNNPYTYAFVCTLTENQEIPLFPSRENDKVVYMNGKKEVFMTMYEYNELKEKGYLEKKIIIHKILGILSVKDVSTFKQFFNPLFEHKKITKFSSEKYFCKILMNGSTGKFGQKPERKEIIYYNRLDIDENKDYHFDSDLDLPYTEKEFEQIFQTTNLPVIITITNLARFTLWKQMIKVRKDNEKVFYCDTDSIVVERKALKLFDINNELGSWNIEKEFARFQAIDSKEYVFTEYCTNDFCNHLKHEKLTVKFKGLITKHFNESDFYHHYTKGSITRIIPKNRYCDIRKIPHNSVIFLRKEKRQFYFKRLINQDLTTKALNSDTIDILKIKENNKSIIYDQIIEPNLISC